MRNDISIVTPHSVYNYGALLQAYGLYSFIKKNGYSVGFYDFPLEKEKITSFKGMIYLIIEKLFKGLYYIPLKKGDKAFDEFMSNYQLNRDESSKMYIVGSDQVWNPNNLNCFFDLSRFESGYKISYAASFGVHKISDVQKKKYGFLKDIKQISVREKTGADILKKMFNCEAEVHLDPSFLLTSSEWRKLEKPLNVSEGYILLYILHIPKNINEIVYEIQKRLKKKVVLIDRKGYLRRLIKCDEVIMEAGPAEFLWLIDHADYVVTSSFHGTVFSIIFQKSFYPLINKAFPSRISDLLKLLEISENEDKDFKYQMKIDYKKTERIIEKERERSIEYLTKSFKEAKIDVN